MAHGTHRVTNYRKAWNDFRHTPEYQELMGRLKDAGIKMPLRNNIINAAFAAGFRASGVEIKFLNS